MDKKIIFPLIGKFIPTESKPKAITLEKFLELLRNEEDYFRGEENNTKLMITRLRKIFYDIYGWDKKLIRKATNIKGRYKVNLINVPYDNKARPVKRKRWRNIFKYYEIIDHKLRLVTVKNGDWMNPNVGETPEIYKNRNQDVILPDGSFCDIGHVLAGLDAYNYLAPVSPLPDFLLFAYRFFPSVDYNTDIVTWLGDIASTSGEFLFKRFSQKKPLDNKQKQDLINTYSDGSDMLGNIDPFVIKLLYDTSSTNGLRITEILKSYYIGNKYEKPYKNRYKHFCKTVGLNNWDGEKFSNEKKWFKYYKKQLKNNTAFYVYSRSRKPISVFLAIMIYFNFYKKILDFDLLLGLFLDALKLKI
ncbi:MAG: hypothetical protein B6I24_04915 [Bacteroidetes bacterium 4572_128]|nr:MAG: hypothetical protein B6I24_04915 [Bacteroidetes bacterium 4572_128]